MTHDDDRPEDFAPRPRDQDEAPTTYGLLLADAHHWRRVAKREIEARIDARAQGARLGAVVGFLVGVAATAAGWWVHAGTP